MAEGKQLPKNYSVKTDCVHYAYSRCKVLNSTQLGKLNCELCNCSFYETELEYTARQLKGKK